MEMHKPLHPVAGCSASMEAPTVTYRFQPGAGWVFSFVTQRMEFFTQAALPKDRSAHGLWETDVFEVFLSEALTEDDVAKAPYLEFQVSPLGQFFALRVLEPRKRFDSTARLPVSVRSEQQGSLWKAEIEIPWKENQPLFGNLYAILGAPEAREYWSAFTPPQKTPDFHVPSQFRKLSF